MSDPEGNSSQSGATQCTAADFETAASRTVTLAFELVGQTVVNLPDLLSDTRLQRAIAEALRDEAQQIMQEQRDAALNQTGTAGGEETTPAAPELRLAEAVVGSDAVRNRARMQLENSPQFRRLRRSLDDFRCAFDATDVGVFVDENSTLLIVIGVVGAVAGSAAMYYFEAGDIPARAINLASDTTILKTGRFELQTGNISFTPSERRIEAALRAVTRWNNVRASLTIQNTFAHDQLQQAGASAEVVVNLGRRVELNIQGNGSWERDHDTDTSGDQNRVTGSLQLGTQVRLSERTSLTTRLLGSITDTDGQLSGRAELGAGVLFRPGNDVGQVNFGLNAFVETRTDPGANQPHFGSDELNVGATVGLRLTLP